MVGALGSSGVLIFLAVFVMFAVVVWLIVDILKRPDFSPGMKVLWIVLAFLFSIITLIFYVLVVRNRHVSKT